MAINNTVPSTDTKGVAKTQKQVNNAQYHIRIIININIFITYDIVMISPHL